MAIHERFEFNTLFPTIPRERQGLYLKIKGKNKWTHTFTPSWFLKESNLPTADLRCYSASWFFFPNLFCSCSSIRVWWDNCSLGWFLFSLLSFCCCSSCCLYYCKAFTPLLLFFLVGCEWKSLKFLFLFGSSVLGFIFEYLVLYRLNSYSQYLSLVY